MSAYKRHEQKRHGKHQKHTKHFLKVYTPYLPLLVIVLTGLVLSLLGPSKTNKNVLAYATSMSVSDLLAATNKDRAAYGLPALKLNSKLDTAAQTKANDMVARNYWAHVTPDGKQPWVFFTNAGYSYTAAGENLAYGFNTSTDTEQGWMNSPEHKANVLNSSYTEVGFGFKNSSNFVGSGQETVVVADYGKPASAPTVAATKSTAAPAAASSTPTKTASNNKPQSTTPLPSSQPQATSVDSQLNSVVATSSQPVNRLGFITGHNFAWLAPSAAIITVIGAVALGIRHAFAINKWIRVGERYVMHHFVFDLTVIGLIGLSFVASQTVGFIR